MRKLTDSDKQEILKLYRESAETTSTLADRYGVSNSTISRLLKSTLPEEEYEYLVSLKRAARTPEGRAQVSYDQLPLLSKSEPATKVTSSVSQPLELPKVQPVKALVEEEPEEDDLTTGIRRVRKRSLSEEIPTPIVKPTLPKKATPIAKPTPQPVAEQLELLQTKPPIIPSIPNPLLDDERPEVKVLAEMLGEDLLDESDDLEDLDDDLEEYDDDYDEDDLEEATPLVTRRRPGEASVPVLPLSAAHLPKTCYLVIDRASELITRPLKDFGDLGQIPIVETQQKTLPVFDNHRVAKRFSTKRDRVIKVPDSKMLHKTRTHLQAKGITRLLIDGQVYSLSTV
ncbi:MAG: transposase [Gloeotrichia echinulata GP01]